VGRKDYSRLAIVVAAALATGSPCSISGVIEHPVPTAHLPFSEFFGSCLPRQAVTHSASHLIVLNKEHPRACAYRAFPSIGEYQCRLGVGKVGHITLMVKLGWTVLVGCAIPPRLTGVSNGVSRVTKENAR